MSARSQVTITLGRSGQVVKRTGSMSDASHSDFEPSSGSKRPIRERLGNNVSDPLSHSSLSKNKRQRTEDRSWIQSADGLEDNKQYMPGRQVSRDDLRYKLLNKTTSKRANTVSDEQNGDLREKLSRSSHRPLRFDAQQHVSGSRVSGLVRQIPPTRSAEDLCRLDSLRKSYSFTSDRPRHRSPDRLLGASRGMSPSRIYDDLRHVPSMRSVDVSRPRNFIAKSVVDVSRPEPLPSKATVPVETAKPAPRAPLASGTSQKTYMSDEPPTVASLLHSLGLGKYAIIFQAEEPAEQTITWRRHRSQIRSLSTTPPRSSETTSCSSSSSSTVFTDFCIQLIDFCLKCPNKTRL